MIENAMTAGIRWCSNILTELLRNYGRSVHPDVRDGLRDALTALGRAEHAARTEPRGPDA